MSGGPDMAVFGPLHMTKARASPAGPFSATQP